MTLIHECTVLVDEPQGSNVAVTEAPTDSPKMDTDIAQDAHVAENANEDISTTKEEPEQDALQLLDENHESASIVADDEPPSELPERVKPEVADNADTSSIVSRAMSALSHVSNNIRKPRVRTVIFDDDRSYASRR